MADLLESDPRTVGEYELDSRIGAGGMGVVYLAHDSLGRRVALKLVLSELADDAAFRSRFRREVESAKKVGGVCTARLLDADLDGKRPYLVAEYVEGGNLADFVADRGALTGEQPVGFAVGLSEALVAMNAVGVIHRDLKPANVLMAPSGPKVVDFGISHAADGTSLTQTGFVVGSPGWMAPEQATGSLVSAAADVFSWGALVVFAATGKSPFGDGRPEAVLYRVVHEFPDLSGVEDRLRPSVAAALQKDPAQRPSSDQLLLTLVKTVMPGVIETGGSGTMATAVLDQTWHYEPEVVALADNHRQGRRGWVAVAAFVLVVALVGAGIIALARHKGPTASSASMVKSGLAGSTTLPSTPPTIVGQTSPSTTPASATTVSAVLPLVVCPTTYGLDPTSTVPLPSTIAESIPSNLANQLAVFTDEQGQLKVLGPSGWSCSANQGVDGESAVQVYPPGSPRPEGSPYKTSTAEALVASQTGGCEGCAVSQASPLFPAAATQCASQFSGIASACPSTPSGESTFPISTTTVGFLDPPGLAGNGNPSGGPYSANGVMIFGATSYTQSWLDTCTLPNDQHALCTAALDNFAQLYGTG